MSIHDPRKTPFPWFGGKSDAAPAVWAALGDVPHYVEPFAGSLAVLMRRPHETNRPYYSETVNDADGLLVNAWRSIQLSPDATAEAASWPVAEADLMARHLALVRWRQERQLEHLMADPLWHDPVMGGWWLWGQSAWIGSGWCSGTGAWVVGEDGRIEKRKGAGVHRKRPHVSNNGQGVIRPQLREPGVCQQLPRVSANGSGVAHGNLRESGVTRQFPRVTDNGQGAIHGNLREPGIGDFHPMTMPELRRWMHFLSARLRHVRILNGDWARCATNGVCITLPVRQGHGPAGVFLDPPYSTDAERCGDLYAHEDLDIANQVREWCQERGADPRYRIVLAGYDGEHNALEEHGWTAQEWFRAGHLKGGMANTKGRTEGEDGDLHQQQRERLWLSPHCLRRVEQPRQVGLFMGGAA